jgi:DNA-binding NarL/FixJ family response regulator
MNAIRLYVVEDNLRLQQALARGLENTGEVQVAFTCANGESIVRRCLEDPPQAILMDVQLSGEMHGIQAAVAIRREYPRLPVVFYSIQDEDAYFQAFIQAGILSHYAYVRKSNYLLPEMILPLIKDAINGRGFVDPDIEQRVVEVRQKAENDPMAVLEPNEQAVARMLAAGMTNEQIAAQMGFRDKRTISRVNGQIYAAWGLVDSAVDEKIARTRAALIVNTGQLIRWDEAGRAAILDSQGNWQDWHLDASL